MKFTIGFEPADTTRLHRYWDEILQTQQWSEGPFTQRFESQWAAYHQLPSLAFASWGGAALAALEFFQVRDRVVLCPSNTFMATPLSVLKAGGNVAFVDCNRDDLCMSVASLRTQIERYQPAAVWVVHIGGHIAFQIEAIAALCAEKGIVLLEDCAHAHGASWHGKRPGSWGDAGVYSFYATKTISTGEGGMLVTRHAGLLDFARQYRNYGKPEHHVQGLNYRMNEFTAAIGCVQVERLDDIVAWKNAYAERHLHRRFPNRVVLPDGMISGYYKYIVFDPVERSTGKVYDTPCHRILQTSDDLPNADWIAEHHWCVPLYYQGNS